MDSFHSPADLGVLRWAYKWTRELARRMDTFRGELVGGHPKFPAGSKAAAKTAMLGPDPIDSPKRLSIQLKTMQLSMITIKTKV